MCTVSFFAVSGFYAECLPKRMYVNGSIYTKSKFLGLSLGVHNIGSGLLIFLQPLAISFIPSLSRPSSRPLSLSLPLYLSLPFSPFIPASLHLSFPLVLTPSFLLPSLSLPLSCLPPPLSLFLVRLFLMDYGEEYSVNLPNGYARSILTIPWFELGGKCHIECKQNGYSADVEFHCKVIINQFVICGMDSPACLPAYLPSCL